MVISTSVRAVVVAATVTATPGTSGITATGSWRFRIYPVEVADRLLESALLVIDP